VKQLLAGVGAVLLVVGAVLLRGQLDGDDAGGDGGSSSVVCPPDIADQCQTLADDHTVEIEPAAETADLLAAGDGDAGDIDAWIVPRPWVEWVVAESDDAAVGEPSESIARSPVALVVYTDRAQALEAGPCRGTVGWRCLGDAADRPWAEVGGEAAWGRVKAGLVDPTSATGMIVLGGATAGFFDSADYASNDFGGELTGWLGALGATAQEAAAGDPVTRMLTRGPGEFAAVGALEVDARQAAGRDNLRVLYPAPVATADLVVVPVDGATGVAADVSDDGELRQSLAEAGWRVEGEPLADGVDPDLELPDDDGLPSGPVLRALVVRWTEATG
jgi:hypothetical protein